MKKNLFIICLAVLFVFSFHQAQAQDTRIGIKGGLSLYSTTISFSSFGFSIDETSDSKIGFAAGVFVEKPVSDMFSLQFEGLFVQKGGKDEDSDLGDGNVTLSYIDVPVLLRFNIPLDKEDIEPFVYGGAFAGYLLDASAESDGEDIDDIDITEFLTNINYGLVLGAGVSFGMLTVDIRYDLGLANIFDDSSNIFDELNGEFDDFDDFGNIGDLLGGIEVSTKGLMLTVGVAF